MWDPGWLLVWRIHTTDTPQALAWSMVSPYVPRTMHDDMDTAKHVMPTHGWVARLTSAAFLDFNEMHQGDLESQVA